MKSTLKELKNKLHSAKEVVAKYTAAIEALQEVCEHDYHYQGHGHNDSLYVCSICGKEEWS